MLVHIFTVFLTLSLSLVSAWRLTEEHADGMYGIDENDEIHFLHDWNKTTALAHASQEHYQRSSTHHWRRQGLPSTQWACPGAYVNVVDVGNCAQQAEAWCGIGTAGSGGQNIYNYNAYAFKSNLVYLYVCNWNTGAGFTNCFSAEVSSAVTLIENGCGYGNGGTQVKGGWIYINDWNVGIGIQNLGADGCPGLKGNHDGLESNPTTAQAQAAQASQAAVY